MKDWWINLNLREKQVLITGSLTLAVIVFYLLIWAPLTEKVNHLREKARHTHELLLWMQSANKQIQSSKQSAAQAHMTHTESLLSLVQNQLQQNTFSKHLTQLRQASEDSVQLNFQTVAFDKLIKWLITLSQEENVVITQMTVTPTDATGLVSATCILQRFQT